MKNNKKAFTLAEVLITLGIIGVVAALTIPTLIANTKGIANRNKFRKAVATFSQAARMSQAKYGFDYSGARRCNSVDDNPEEVNSICAMWNGTLSGSKGFNSAEGFKEQYKDSNPEEQFIIASDLDLLGAWQLADGTIFFTFSTLTNFGDLEDVERLPYKTCTVGPKGIGELFVDGVGCFGWIDVNGPEGPNKPVKCTTGTLIDMVPDGAEKIEYDSTNFSKFPCTVSNKDITDQFPVFIHDGLMEPASNAARYVMYGNK